MNFRYFCVIVHFLLLFVADSTIVAMEEVNPQHALSKYQAVRVKQPQTLCQLFGISGLEAFALKDVRSIIAREIVGDGGWWYKHAMWQGEDTKLVAVSPGGNRFASAMYTREDGTLQNEWRIDLRDLSGTIIKSLRYPNFFTKLIFIDNDLLVFNGAGTCRMVRWKLNEESYVVPEMNFSDKEECHISACSAHLEEPELLVRFNSDMVYLCSSNLTTRHLLSRMRDSGFARFHPSKEIVIIDGKDGLSAFDFTGKLISLIKLDKDFWCPIMAFKGDLVLLSDRYRGTGIWNIKNDTFNTFKPQETRSFYDVVFHPKQDVIVGIGDDKSLCLWSLNGRKLLKFPHASKVTKVCSAREACTIVTVCNKGGDSAIWHEYERPTLDQVLLRLLLNRYVANCHKMGVGVEICTQTDQMVEWLTSKFNLQENCIKRAWDGMPLSMRAGILATLAKQSRVD